MASHAHEDDLGRDFYFYNSAQIETFLSSRASIVSEPNFDYLILKLNHLRSKLGLQTQLFLSLATRGGLVATMYNDV